MEIKAKEFIDEIFSSVQLEPQNINSFVDKSSQAEDKVQINSKNPQEPDILEFTKTTNQENQETKEKFELQPNSSTVDEFVFKFPSYIKKVFLNQEESKTSNNDMLSKNSGYRCNAYLFFPINMNISSNIKPKNLNLPPKEKPNPNQQTQSSQVIQNLLSQNFPNQFTFSCCLQTKTKRFQKEQEFSEKIVPIADVSNVKEFWEVFQHLKKIKDCEPGTEYHLFKKGIRPMWEDKANSKGGKFTVLLAKEYCEIIWEEVVFGFCKGLLPYWEFINGLVISVRPGFVVLGFWIKNLNNINENKENQDNKEKKERGGFVSVENIRYCLSRFIQAPSYNCFDYIAFD